MIHGQGIKAQPRQLLKAIPHLALKEAFDAGVCCGSAGIYNLVQPEAAAELGRMKVTDLAQTGPTWPPAPISAALFNCANTP